MALNNNGTCIKYRILLWKSITENYIRQRIQKNIHLFLNKHLQKDNFKTVDDEWDSVVDGQPLKVWHIL